MGGYFSGQQCGLGGHLEGWICLRLFIHFASVPIVRRRRVIKCKPPVWGGGHIGRSDGSGNRAYWNDESDVLILA